MLEFLIFRGWLEAEQADALAPCGGASVFGTYRDTILYLFTRLENEAPRAFATWVPCAPQIIPPLDDAQACSNNVQCHPTVHTNVYLSQDILDYNG